MPEKKTIAVLGASSDRSKFGNKCVRAYADGGWEVYPINPGAEKIEGFQAYAKLADVPVALDRISVYLPPPLTDDMIPEMAEKGAGEVWFNPGSADRFIVDKAKAAGLEAIAACSIVDIGKSPARYS